MDIYDIGQKVTSQLTRHPDTDHFPIWSPGGTYVAFHRYLGTDRGIFQMRADGATPEQVLIPPDPAPRNTGICDWGRDFVVFSRIQDLPGIWELWALPLSGDRKPFRYLDRFSGCLSGSAALSPNGRWLAYEINVEGVDRIDGGVTQVIVQSFPDHSQRRLQISAKGGSSPRWSSSGRELFFIDSAQTVVAVSVLTDGPFEVQGRTGLFASPSPWYDVASRGERFLFNVSSTALPNPAPINLVLNWTTGLK